jgi:hypothetical protein
MSGVAATRPAAAGRWLAGAALARQRIGAPVLAVALLGALVAAAMGAVERGHGPVGAPDRSVLVVARLVVPLVSFAICGAVLGRVRLGDSAWCVARFGVPRRTVTLGLVGGAMAACAAAAALAVLAALAAAYGGGPGLAHDAVATGWIAALGGASYAACLAVGHGMLRLGRGRFLVLGLDFLFGVGEGALAVIWPRSHLESLLGGSPVLELTQQASSVILGALALGAWIVAAWRTGD